MLKSIAYPSLTAAAANRPDAKSKAAGNEALQLEAKRMLTEKAEVAHMQYSYASPQEPDASLRGALLSDGQYRRASEYDERHMAIAASMIAADLVEAAVSTLRLRIVTSTVLRQQFREGEEVFATLAFLS